MAPVTYIDEKVDLPVPIHGQELNSYANPFNVDKVSTTQLVCLDQERFHSDVPTQTEPLKSQRAIRTPRFQVKKTTVDHNNRDPRLINSYITVSINIYVNHYDMRAL